MDYVLLGQRICAAHLAAGLSQEQLAEMDDVQAVFSDCNPDEVYVTLEAANAVKKSIRVRKLKRRD